MDNEKITRGEDAPAQEYEVCIDVGRVSVPISYYEDLIRARTERDVLVSALRYVEEFRLADIMRVVLGPYLEDGADDAE